MAITCTPREYISAITECYRQHADSENAQKMARYLRDQFPLFGIKTPQRRELTRSFWQNHGVPEGENLKKIVQLLWEEEKREMQYFAMDLLQKRLRYFNETYLPFLEQFIVRKSWWDTVDWLAANGIGRTLQKYPDLISPLSNRWIASDNIWLQRTALIFQLRYREKTDFVLLRKHILRRIDSEEFFVQKGAGWALRQYAKFNPSAVINFVRENESRLAPLTQREALKHHS